jgi:alkanesulfonate monooxygenase SsuD/methylene tetrahydromethanopterin reductase-like flavin-dependent oxidoreductase (luciferase family)
MHELNHVDKHFKVKGPLNVAEMPQGHPILFEADAAGEGRDIVAQLSEVLYTAQDTIEDARAYYDDVKGRLARHGRD